MLSSFVLSVRLCRSRQRNGPRPRATPRTDGRHVASSTAAAATSFAAPQIVGICLDDQTWRSERVRNRRRRRAYPKSGQSTLPCRPPTQLTRRFSIVISFHFLFFLLGFFFLYSFSFQSEKKPLGPSRPPLQKYVSVAIKRNDRQIDF